MNEIGLGVRLGRTETGTAPSIIEALQQHGEMPQLVTQKSGLLHRTAFIHQEIAHDSWWRDQVVSMHVNRNFVELAPIVLVHHRCRTGMREFFKQLSGQLVHDETSSDQSGMNSLAVSLSLGEVQDGAHHTPALDNAKLYGSRFANVLGWDRPQDQDIERALNERRRAILRGGHRLAFATRRQRAAGSDMSSAVCSGSCENDVARLPQVDTFTTPEWQLSAYGMQRVSRDQSGRSVTARKTIKRKQATMTRATHSIDVLPVMERQSIQDFVGSEPYGWVAKPYCLRRESLLRYADKKRAGS